MSNRRLEIISPTLVETAYKTLGKAQTGADGPFSLAFATTGDSIVSSYYANNEYYLYENSYYNGHRTMSILKKIPRATYRKLYMEIEIFRGSSNLDACWSVTFNSTGILTGSNAGNFQGTNFKTLYLANNSWTVEQINQQSGITINCTEVGKLSRQTVEIDISDITEDFWICTYMNYDYANIYNLYLDVV